MTLINLQFKECTTIIIPWNNDNIHSTPNVITSSPNIIPTTPNITPSFGQGIYRVPLILYLVPLILYLVPLILDSVPLILYLVPLILYPHGTPNIIPGTPNIIPSRPEFQEKFNIYFSFWKFKISIWVEICAHYSWILRMVKPCKIPKKAFSAPQISYLLPLILDTCL